MTIGAKIANSYVCMYVCMYVCTISCVHDSGRSFEAGELKFGRMVDLYEISKWYQDEADRLRGWAPLGGLKI